jgi:hypothetical protein
MKAKKKAVKKNLKKGEAQFHQDLAHAAPGRRQRTESATAASINAPSDRG